METWNPSQASYFQNAISRHTHGEDVPRPFNSDISKSLSGPACPTRRVTGVTNHPVQLEPRVSCKLVCSGWSNSHNTQLCGKGASPSSLLIRESKLEPWQGLAQETKLGFAIKALISQGLALLPTPGCPQLTETEHPWVLTGRVISQTFHISGEHSFFHLMKWIGLFFFYYF